MAGLSQKVSKKAKENRRKNRSGHWGRGQDLFAEREAKHIFTHKEWHMKGCGILVEPVDFEQSSPYELQNGYVMVSKEETKQDYPIPSAFFAFTKYLDIRPGMGKEIGKK